MLKIEIEAQTLEGLKEKVQILYNDVCGHVKGCDPAPVQDVPASQTLAPRGKGRPKKEAADSLADIAKETPEVIAPLTIPPMPMPLPSAPAAVSPFSFGAKPAAVDTGSLEYFKSNTLKVIDGLIAGGKITEADVESWAQSFQGASVKKWHEQEKNFKDLFDALKKYQLI